jgi:cell division protein FtsB
MRVALASLAFVAILFMFVFPTQALLAQRSDLADARSDLDVLRDQNAKLEEEAARLQTPAEIERIARERFNMVRPGEQAFAVVPATTTTTAP